jgi:protein TonB
MRRASRSEPAAVWALCLLAAAAVSSGCASTTPDPAPAAVGGMPSPPPRDPSFGEYVPVDELPEAIQKIPPVYPEAARQSGLEGTVMLQALVGRDGLVREVRVTQSVAGLDEAAIEAVRQWWFKPARSKGEPVAVWVAVPIRFPPR